MRLPKAGTPDSGIRGQAKQKLATDFTDFTATKASAFAKATADRLRHAEKYSHRFVSYIVLRMSYVVRGIVLSLRAWEGGTAPVRSPQWKCGSRRRRFTSNGVKF